MATKVTNESLEQKLSTDDNESGYKASYNTGIYGSYLHKSTASTKKKPVIKQLKYGKSRGVSILKEWNVNNECTFCICKGSVVDFIGDAIVNAANERATGGGYVDHAIGKAGGKMLKRYRMKLPILSSKGIRCRTGDAVITKSGIGADDCTLQCKYVIHAVGPNYKRSI